MPYTILLVEDDQDIQDIMYYMLSDAGYQLIRSKGDDAVAQAQTGVVDLVLLDLRLPTISGADICRMLKDDVRTACIPVILVSATMNLKATVAKAGADLILEKPFGMQELITIVATALNGDHSQ